MGCYAHVGLLATGRRPPPPLEGLEALRSQGDESLANLATSFGVSGDDNLVQVPDDLGLNVLAYSVVVLA